MKKLLNVFIFLLCSIVVTTNFTLKKSYENWKVVEITPLNESHLGEFFKILPKDNIDILTNDARITVGEKMEILLSPEQLTAFEIKSQNSDNLKGKLNFKIIVQNLQEILNREEIEMKNSQKNFFTKIELQKSTEEKKKIFYSDEFFTTYHKYDTIIRFVKGLSSEYPNMIEEFEIGKSIEQRPILGFRIHSPGQWNNTKNAIWINSLQHAREWVSIPTSLYSIFNLLREYRAGNERVKNLLNSVNIHYAPVVNPDGYIYSHEKNRMWRKNLRGGYGVDLNRNWVSGWGGQGSSSNRNSEIYRGESPLSEPETKSVSDYLKSNNQKIKATLDFHSYSQLILRPYGRITGVTPDEAYLTRLGLEVTNEIKRPFSMNYGNIRAAQLGVAHGMDDDMYDTLKFGIVYCFELRPSSAIGGGFSLPERFILPTCQENYLAVLRLLEEVKNK